MLVSWLRITAAWSPLLRRTRKSAPNTVAEGVRPGTQSKRMSTASPPELSKTTAAQPEKKVFSPANRQGLKIFAGTVAGSFLIWLLLWLFAADMTLKFTKPLKYVGMGGYIANDKNPVRVKLELLSLPWCRPDVLVIGSSLAMNSFACADAHVYKQPAPHIGYELYSYTKSLYLEEKLKSLTGKNVSAFDLAVGGCMLSDGWEILNKALELRPAVKMVILAVGPRDFVDTTAAENPADSTVIKYLKEQEENVLVPEILSSQRKFERMLSRMWHYFNIRADYKTFFSLLGCSVLDRRADLYSAAAGFVDGDESYKLSFSPRRPSADSVLGPDYKKRDAAIYYNRYNPFSEKRMITQFGYLEKTLALCKEKGIIVVVADLPVSELNRKQMAKEMKEKYYEVMKSTCRKFAAPLVELDRDPLFVDDDFRDTVHPVGSGGKKIIDRVSEAISRDGKLLYEIKTRL